MNAQRRPIEPRDWGTMPTTGNETTVPAPLIEDSTLTTIGQASDVIGEVSLFLGWEGYDFECTTDSLTHSGLRVSTLRKTDCEHDWAHHEHDQGLDS